MDPRKNIYFYYQPSPEVSEKVKKLRELSERYGLKPVENSRDANIIVSVGGDGTFLQAVRKSGFRDDCLYAGISVENQVGAYSDFHVDETDEMVEAMTSEKVEVRKYPTIQVTVDDEAAFYCLNECTIRSSIVKTFVMEVYIDDLHFETFRGDGMIIATPTGSTGYNKSINGAVVDPLLHCFQVSELASLNNNIYRTLGSSFILSGDRTLTLKVVHSGNDFPIVSMDNEALSIRNLRKIEVKLSGKIVKVIKLKDNSFWEKVKRTFL
ncbi:MAG: NAD kinase [Caldibacillus debilis]|jgi:NAD+ kinase|uniref:NAD kinase n=1 Tax=Caldibacillus debilis TaxID=301148 RepID=A0A3E0K8C1_9BACI|nr:NAD kinase [Caldibacillus debilis]REJ31446.1 MAG: NAD kinase [Caldibacillus debilis]